LLEHVLVQPAAAFEVVIDDSVLRYGHLSTGRNASRDGVRHLRGVATTGMIND
jgi:hypothetical protein